MNIKNTILLILFFSSISFFSPIPLVAIDSSRNKAPSDSFVVRVIEKIEYFFAFGTDKKIAVLEKQAENKLVKAQNFANNGNQEKTQNQLQNYLSKKEEQNNLLEKTGGEAVIKNVEERTVEQQKTMEKIKMIVDDGIKQEIIQVQEQVVNQVAQRVVEFNGKEGQTEFFNKVEHIWAPGTGPGGGESGVVYEGGAGQQYAPGTSAEGDGGVVYEGGAKIMFAPGTSGGEGGRVDIKTVEVKSN